MHNTSLHLDPGPILQTAFAFWSSKVLLTAVEFDVFTKLGNRRITGAELGDEVGPAPARHQRFLRRSRRDEVPRPRGRRPGREVFQHARRRALSRPRQPSLCRWLASDAQRAALQVLARLARGLAHRQAAERSQARPEGNVRGALRGAAETRTVHGRDDRPLADQLRSVRGEV